MVASNSTRPPSQAVDPHWLAEHLVGVDEAVTRLQAGQLVALPTETVYGLAAMASNAQAVSEIFKLKGRPADRPLIVHMASSAQLDEWAVEIPEYARALAHAFWPGPMALVLKKRSHVLDAVTGGQDSVALRVPNHPLTLEILERLGGGVAAPSANRYGSISPTDPQAVAIEFGDECPAILDGGACSVGVESTIVSCLGSRPRILRPGAVGAEEIAWVSGLEVDGSEDELTKEAPSVVVPGQVLSHYAPKTPCVCLERAEMAHAVAAWWADHEAKHNSSSVPRVGFLGYQAPPFEADACVVWPLEAGAVAQHLYRDLRRMDQQGLDLIVVEAVPWESVSGKDASGLWGAIEDRLQRACSGA